MTVWDIPADTDELFANGSANYSICDRGYPGDNVYGMRLFLESVGVPPEMIELDDGTQVTLSGGQKRLVVDCGGLGDFHKHGFCVTELQAGQCSD